jgi:large subunit ribosomal protein L17
MRHGFAFRKLGRDSKHRRAMLRNLTTQLIKHDTVTTTLARAKELRRIADKMVMIAKQGGVEAIRKLNAYIFEKEVAKRAYLEFPIRFADRKGGFTRVIPYTKRRLGDGAKMAMIEYLDYDKIPRAKPTITESRSPIQSNEPQLKEQN